MKNTTAAKPAQTAALFSRRIGNTTYFVSVAFSKKSGECIEDKVLRLAVSELNQQREEAACI